MLGGVTVTRPLYVNELFIENFGGLANQRVDLGGQGIIVIFGGNEAGKSTAATALSWLLVGPHGSAEESHRYGQPQDRLNGRLEGTFDGNPLRIDGQFVLLAKGAPNIAGVKPRLGGGALTIDYWRGLLGGIDSAVFNAVYRMWGGDLHDSYAIIDEVAQVALAGLGGNVRVSDVLKRLDEKRKEFLTSDRLGTNSWNSLQKTASGIEAEIKKSGTNAQEYSDLCREVETIKGDLHDRRNKINRQSQRLLSVRTLEAVSSEREREWMISSELKALEVVPSEWEQIALNVADLEAVISQIEDHEAVLKNLHDAVKSICHRLGVEETQVQQMSISAGQPVTVTRIHGKLTAARQAAIDSRAALLGVEDSLKQAELVRQHAEDDLRQVGVSIDNLVMPTESESGRLSALINEWKTVQTEVVSAEKLVSIQAGKVHEAESSLKLAQELWAQFGVQQSAQEWRVAPKHQTVDSAGTAIGGRLLLPGVLAVVIAGASVALFPRVVAGIITAAVVAALAAVWIRLQPAQGMRVIDAMSSDVEKELEEASVRVVVAFGLVQNSRAELIRLETERDAKASAVEFPKDRVQAEMRRFGLKRECTIEESQAILERISEFRGAENKLSEERSNLFHTQSQTGKADELEESLVAEFASLVRSCGLPANLSVDEVAENIEDFFQLASRIKEARQVDEERDRLSQRLQSIVSGLEPKDKERSRNSLLTEARRFAALEEKKRALEDERNRLNDTVNSRFRDDMDAKSLSNELRERERILDEIRLLEEANRIDSEAIEQMNRELGELETRISALEDEDRLSTLKLEMGQKLDLSDDQLVSGVVQAVAYSLLKHHANERRRNNQPKLIAQANQLLSRVADTWEKILIDTNESGSIAVSLSKEDGRELSSARLSTGARALTHLAIRLAMVRSDRERRQVCFPVICDDPLVHFDDERAQLVMPLLAEVAADGHQVILFTCHGRTVDAGRAVGARVVQLG